MLLDTAASLVLPHLHVLHPHASYKFNVCCGRCCLFEGEAVKYCWCQSAAAIGTRASCCYPLSSAFTNACIHQCLLLQVTCIHKCLRPQMPTFTNACSFKSSAFTNACVHKYQRAQLPACTDACYTKSRASTNACRP